MRRTLSILTRLAALAVVIRLVQAVRADRAPRRALEGTRPLVGSIDTWPTVPRRPSD
jgi:hypothetical protein